MSGNADRATSPVAWPNPPRWVWLAAIALLAALASAWLAYQGYRYFVDPGELAGREVSVGAIDVHNRYLEVRSWFGGEPVYSIYKDAVYPPASYVLLALAFNVLSWPVAKVLWFAASFASVCVLARQVVRHGLASSWHERAFLGLMPFAFYATGAALGNGQLVPFVLPMILAALLRLGKPTLSARDVWSGSLLMLAALVQPIIAAPFFWLVLFRSPRRSPAIVVVVGYIALTLFALPFQMSAIPASGGAADPVAVMDTWTRKAQGGAYYGSVAGGYGTVHDLLAEFGLREWNSATSIAILLVLGGWLFRRRRADLWLLVGVTAIVARVWTYHRWYDDLLLVLPLLSLFRLTRLPGTGARTRVVATGLFLWIFLFLLAPGVRYTLPAPEVALAIQVSGWLASLAFLVWIVERGERDLTIR